MGFLPKIIPSLPLLLAGDRWGLYQLDYKPRHQPINT